MNQKEKEELRQQLKMFIDDGFLSKVDGSLGQILMTLPETADAVEAQIAQLQDQVKLLSAYGNLFKRLRNQNKRLNEQVHQQQAEIEYWKRKANDDDDSTGGHASGTGPARELGLGSKRRTGKHEQLINVNPDAFDVPQAQDNQSKSAQELAADKTRKFQTQYFLDEEEEKKKKKQKHHHKDEGHDLGGI